MTTTVAPPTRRRAPAPLPAAPEKRGVGARAGGKFEDRAHYIPVGHRLRLLRTEAGLNQRQLETLTRQIDPAGRGLTAYSINRFENGVHSPRPRNVELLAAALAQALGRPVGAQDLRVQGAEGLATYLEGIRRHRQVALLPFYEAVGLGPRRTLAIANIELQRLQADAARAETDEELRRKTARAQAQAEQIATAISTVSRPGPAGLWSAEELGRIAMEFPEAADLVRDALVDQAQRARRKAA